MENKIIWLEPTMLAIWLHKVCSASGDYGKWPIETFDINAPVELAGDFLDGDMGKMVKIKQSWCNLNYTTKELMRGYRIAWVPIQCLIIEGL